MPAYQLASREYQQEDTVIELKTCRIGSGQVVIIAGPCAVESEEQMLGLASTLKEMGVHILRGGAFKPRTSPYSFRGLGEEGLRILARARELTGLPVVTEITDVRNLDMVLKYADILQIGSRNMQNFDLLREVGRVHRPVLLKRGLAATIEEWLLAAEYILAEGNRNVILCERGIRTYETYTRNTLDISAIPAIKELSHLPVIADPSHGTGRRSLVAPVARAAVAAGADGLMLEVHPCPEEALSDGPQSLLPAQLEHLLAELRPMAESLGRRLSGSI
ncbi:3-deoxy-D-arabinoheptulosonate-7-phosphate synthase [Desulfofundulus australicus DSM 11792]|uniref:3-deoxy-D-arabinoheptulosonate-7-phosphate synthase n=1 Tax=Desulfofundulus australicus DSM 11792 TaxID=1121425 RepID=A0A1M4VYT9_9FIRM|nr:3-deoxy-7-phosphoheptulonate synthase [Desulfofundulus australicus]SHE74033.1 3-deoxy-D-arabinoheptulosonate-7-phosphate synthase [Desulfofundulus australicus DSM 11792]